MFIACHVPCRNNRTRVMMSYVSAVVLLLLNSLIMRNRWEMADQPCITETNAIVPCQLISTVTIARRSFQSSSINNVYCKMHRCIISRICMEGCGWGCAPKSCDFVRENRNRNYGSQVSFVKIETFCWLCLSVSLLCNINCLNTHMVSAYSSINVIRLCDSL